MPRFLLDTNILSDLVRHPQGLVAKRIEAEGEESICTSIVVAGELHFGSKKRGSKRVTTQLEDILSALEILPLEEPADRRYGELRTYLEKRGETIGPNDMLIAAHAQALADPGLLTSVVEFKQRFYPRGWARYDLAKPGSLRLVPEGHVLAAVRSDYRAMKNMIFGEVLDFNEILAVLMGLQEEINT